jgi:hypothetical protein
VFLVDGKTGFWFLCFRYWPQHADALTNTLEKIRGNLRNLWMEKSYMDSRSFDKLRTGCAGMTKEVLLCVLCVFAVEKKFFLESCQKMRNHVSHVSIPLRDATKKEWILPVEVIMQKTRHTRHTRHAPAKKVPDYK